MQGLGRPIISLEEHGYRIVAVGNRMRWSRSWHTFHDFLFDYIKLVLTPEWGRVELAKSEDDQHPVLRWYRKLCEFQKRHAGGKHGEIYSATMTGAVKAYLGLAYDLYLSAHNAELPQRLLKRIRSIDQFEGALYEAFVIGCFAKAGFEITFENEDDATISHCEFTATHKQTKRKFSVEAKSVTTASKRSGASQKPPTIHRYLEAALRKQMAHPRIVFIELSRTHRTIEEGEPEWVPHISEQIVRCERDIAINGQPAPPAYVFVTNRAFVHDLDGTAGIELWAAVGFNIEDFPPERRAHSMIELYRARQRHIEIHWLLKALETHNESPTTFDDRLPEEAFGEMPEARLRLGDSYLVPNAFGLDVPGVLVEASVLPSERKVYGIYRLANGEQIICTVPLTEAEMKIYNRSPDSFFGEMKHVSRGINGPLEAFDFIHSTYSKSSREKLLEFMADWPQLVELNRLSQQELSEHYSAVVATQIWYDIANGRAEKNRS